MSALDIWRGNRPSSLLSTWDAFSRDFDQTFREMERMMAPQSGSSEQGSRFAPACDVEETDQEYRISMDVPGIKKDDIEIEITGNHVRVSGERKQESEDRNEKERRYSFERSYGRFSRTFTLPEGIEEKGIEAHYDNGVLNLTLPKGEVSSRKKIEIKEGAPRSGSKLKEAEKPRASNE